MTKFPAVFLTIIVSAAVLTAASSGFQLYDFSIYWMAAALFVRGQPAYEGLAGLQLLAEFRDWIPTVAYLQGCSEFWNPPPVLLLFSGFGLLSLQTAKELFLFLAYAGAGLSIFFAFQLFRPCSDLRGRKDLLLLLCILPLGTFTYGLAWGAVSWIAVLGIVGAIASLNRGHTFSAGVILAIAGMLRPHTSLILGLCLCFAALKNRSLAFLLGLGSTGVVFTFGAFLVSPDIYAEYFQFVARGGIFNYQTSTLSNLLFHASGYREVLLVLPVVSLGIVGFALVRYWTRFTLAEWCAVLSPFSVVLAAYGWGHDYFSLVLLAMFFFAERQSFEREVWLRLFAVLLLSNVLAYFLTIDETYSIPLFILFGLCWAYVALRLAERRLFAPQR